MDAVSGGFFWSGLECVLGLSLMTVPFLAKIFPLPLSILFIGTGFVMFGDGARRMKFEADDAL